ncbi:MULTISPECIES: DUF4041 domain-containing protein [Eubacterium]|uniref:Bacteriophage T5 Orf172 DNA-binding domain-containing protein n=1 Tax=Eubacterium limosum TaxID=1736 RepID=A0AAC9QV25_EUBLI|nr:MULTISPECIES: DUF4041 domain-containing protein [Eubacterium]ARD66066.1 hypothetical protein B2M23_11170 [Eubacterium limosum]PWW46706.1 T5orf172 domain-containing protein [Eubacterium limosum]UQZ22599.1 DUF4041 domain-containing protein [Eubacterium limosum]
MALFDKFKKQISDSLSSAQEQIKDKAEELTPAAKNKEYQAKIKTLEAENKRLRSALSPELMNSTETISALDKERESLEIKINRLNNKLLNLKNEIQIKKKELIILDDETLYQDFGLYSPIYDLVNSEAYKDKIAIIRQRQKDMIKNDTACTYSKNMTLNNSLSKGQKMVKDNVKQALRTFNNECETVTAKVKFNNIESIRNRIVKSKESLEKLNKAMDIQISEEYLDLKLQELNLCYEYALKKQQEKEAAKEERERLREEAKLAKEIEEARKNIRKEQNHYQNALKMVTQQIEKASPEELPDLNAKKLEIENKISEINAAIKDIDYREANKRAGYVYIISNIGAFGENVYKIGMTRRLEPLDRVNELGDASVPFNFDVHAMIFSDDAPSLENALHKAFEDKKINMVNQRREFFNVTLDEIINEVQKNHDKTVDFIRTPQAEQYRESMMLKKQAHKAQ